MFWQSIWRESISYGDQHGYTRLKLVREVTYLQRIGQRYRGAIQHRDAYNGRAVFQLNLFR